MQRRIIAVSLALIFCSGCSFVFVNKPPPPPLWDKVTWSDCTDSIFLPGMDMAMTVLSGLGTLILAVGNASTGTVVGGAAETLIWGLSASYGFKHVGRCEGFKASKGIVGALLPEWSSEGVETAGWFDRRVQASYELNLRR